MVFHFDLQQSEWKTALTDSFRVNSIEYVWGLYQLYELWEYLLSISIFHPSVHAMVVSSNHFFPYMAMITYKISTSRDFFFHSEGKEMEQWKSRWNFFNRAKKAHNSNRFFSSETIKYEINKYLLCNKKRFHSLLPPRNESTLKCSGFCGKKRSHTITLTQ